MVKDGKRESDRAKGVGGVWMKRKDGKESGRVLHDKGRWQREWG